MSVRLDELAAVNQLLASIGESPVNSLIDLTAIDANLALDTLHEVNTQVQIEGWKFNTEYQVKIMPDSEGKIALPHNILVMKNVSLGSHCVPRGKFLYNTKEQSYEFNEALTADFITQIDFIDLPIYAQKYITIKASRLFQDRMVGSESMHRYSKEDEYHARGLLTKTEIETDSHNILDGFEHIQR